jgi:hypothetical protein
MKFRIIFILGLFYITTGYSQMYSDSISVNFFLLDECRISQNISGEINRVVADFEDEIFQFSSYFPSKSSTVKKIDGFMKTYKINTVYYTDYDKVKTNFYGATIAPQVVVYDEKNNKVLYSGRIDNSYDKVGSRRRVVTSKDLYEALDSIKNNEEITQAEIPAIGCVL